MVNFIVLGFHLLSPCTHLVHDPQRLQNLIVLMTTKQHICSLRHGENQTNYEYIYINSESRAKCKCISVAMSSYSTSLCHQYFVKLTCKLMFSYESLATNPNIIPNSIQFMTILVELPINPLYILLWFSITNHERATTTHTHTHSYGIQVSTDCTNTSRTTKMDGHIRQPSQ